MLACRRLTLAFRTAVAAPRVSARTMMNGSHAEWQRGLRFASTSEGGKPASPVSWKSMAAILVVGGAFISYFQLQRDQLKQEHDARKNKSVGQTMIGGPFTLIDTSGKEVTDKDFRGKWLLLYFGFTFCPDVCPEELNKIGELMELYNKRTDKKGELVPVFISVDPRRDTPDKIATYLKDFHPSFVGLTGTNEQLKAITKAYRVYFSAPSADPTDTDYLVDHSIMTYLIDPEGHFAAYYGQNAKAGEVADKISMTTRGWHPSEE